MSICANRNVRLFTAAAACLIAGMGQVVRGSVLPSSSQPLGYTLSALGADTAVYNTGIQTGNAATPPPPSIPFTVLEGDISVPSNQYLYLPVFYADNSAPVDPNFPASITNQAADAGYLDSLVLTNYHVSAFVAQIDGQETVLDDSYIVGVNTPTLLDGVPGGNEYITSAAVLSPLPVGTHKVGFGGIINGSPVIFGSYNVSVPEPGSIAAIVCAAVPLMSRRRRNRTVAD